MTRLILTLYLTIYSFLRLFFIVGLYYYETMTLPIVVVAITAITCVIALVVTFLTFAKQLSGKTLRLPLFMFAVIAIVNVALSLIDQVEIMHVSEILVTGTLFDILLFASSLTFHIGDTGIISKHKPSTVRKK